MKKVIIPVFILILSANVFAFGCLETFEDKVLKHPLVRSYDFDASNDSLGYSFTLKLKNGHEIYFQDVKSNLTFGKWGGIMYVNDVRFLYVEYKNSVNKGGFGYLRIKDLCKATGTNYNNVLSILDNYNEFCRLLNSLTWTKDASAEEVCAKYTDNYCVYLYRAYMSDENKFIEIPKDLDYSSFGRETLKVDFSKGSTQYFK
ncbi:MAG: hypothetical protein GX297_09920 [Treponema sp.]|nr:hypothetical protein [Treponema sp.]